VRVALSSLQYAKSCRDIDNWNLICKTLDIELHYVLQPFANWVDKELSKEELDKAKLEVEKIILGEVFSPPQ